MELKKTSPGYPCSSYIISKIKTSEELWLYAKTFVQSAKERGLSSSDIILRLTASFCDLNVENGVSRPNLTELGTNDDERCEYLLTNPLVGKIKSCETLYRKIDSHTGACRLCQYSKLYRNKNIDTEYAVLKYMLKSEGNLNYVAEQLDEEFFSSCMDVSMGIPVAKAYVLPMCKILVQSMLKNNIRLMLFSPIKSSFFMCDEPFDIVWEDAYRTFPRNRKIPVGLSNNPVWQNVLKATIQEKIQGAKDLTREDMIEIFNDYILTGFSIGTLQNNSAKEPNTQQTEQLKLEDILVQMKPPKVKGETKLNNVPKTPKPPTVSNDLKNDINNINIDGVHKNISENNKEELEPIIDSSDIQAPDIEHEEMESVDTNGEVTESMISSTEIEETENDDTTDNIAEESFYTEEPDYYNRNNYPSYSSDMVPQQAAPQRKPLSVSVAVLDPPDVEDSTLEEDVVSKEDDSENIEETVVEQTLTEEEIYLLNEKNLILHPVLPDYIRKNNILHIRKNKPLPAAFYQGVLRDKEMYIEVVRAEDGRYLYLIWSKHMKKFITISLMDSSDELKRLLSFKSIKKICHTPYALYGASKLYNITVKNVFSMQTVYARLFPAADTLPYIDLCKTFKSKTQYSAYTKDKYSELCPFLGGMPMYREMHSTLLNMIQTYGYYSMFVKDCYLDEALGCSYYYGLNFSDKGTLFLLTGNNQFFFTKDYYRKTITNGRCYGYFVKENIDAIALFQYILQRLAEKGIFRTTNLQILGMDGKQFQLFVETDKEHYISSLIDMIAFEYGKTYLSKPLLLHNVIHEI